MGLSTSPWKLLATNQKRDAKGIFSLPEGPRYSDLTARGKNLPTSRLISRRRSQEMVEAGLDLEPLQETFPHQDGCGNKSAAAADSSARGPARGGSETKEKELSDSPDSFSNKNRLREESSKRNFAIFFELSNFSPQGLQFADAHMIRKLGRSPRCRGSCQHRLRHQPPVG